MDVAPLTKTSPTGWTANQTGGGAGDGFAIQWVANSSAFYLTPGNSLTFEFTSTETPAQLSGKSPFFPAISEGTTVVYSAGPFSDAGTTFAVTAAAVPEPSSLALTLLGGLALVARKRIGRRART